MLDNPELLDALPCATLITDGEGLVLHANAALEALAGKPANGWSGQRIEDILPLASRIFLQTHIWPTLLRTDRIDEVYLPLRGAQAKPLPVLLSARRYQPAERPADMRFSWAIFPTGERQRFESELLRARQRLQHLIQSTNAGTWEWNLLTGELRVNDRWASMIGASIAELGSVDHEFRFSIGHPDELARTRRLLQEHLDGQSDEYVAEVRLHHRDGSWVWVQDRGRVVSRTEDGRPEWMFGVHIDISAMKRQEDALRRSEQLLNRTNELAGVGGWELDLRTQALYWSEQTCRIHGVPIGYRPSLEEALAFYPPESRSQVEAAVQASLAGGGGWDLELPFVRRDGVPLMVHALGEVHSESDVPVRLVGVFQDVTARYRMLEELRRAKVAAEAASAAKSMFLANMSHEIRTPMNAVIGIAHLLAETSLDEDQRQLLGKLQVAGRSLLAIINDILDLAKIESGELSVAHMAYRPAELLQELDSILGDQARAKGLQWSMTIDEALPLSLLGDPERLRQVLVNLLNNALKFTPQGSVSLALTCSEAPAGGLPRLRFTVRDTGIGISPEAQAQLFQPFVQAEASTTRRFGGTGLGLSIVKHLVGLMGGSIEMYSQPGQGSEFVVELPMQALQDDDRLIERDAAVVVDDVLPRERPSGLPPNVTLLVVDDSDINLEVARRMLERQGATVHCETQAAHAIARLQRGERFDAVLMDIQMPGMDGLEATRRIRRELGLTKLKVIALTAGALLEERRRALDAGMDDFLTKPLDPAALVRTLSRHVAAQRGEMLLAPGAATVTALPADWPEIEGIAAAEVAHRLDGDAALFRRLLARLLAGHDLAWQARLRTLDAPQCVAELHKLRGSAGLLGAHRLHELATQGETRLRSSGDPPASLQALFAELDQCLLALGLAALPWLAQQEPVAAEEPLAQPLVDGEQRFTELLALLRQQDLGAAEALFTLQSWLRAQGMAEQQLRQMLSLVNQLDYEPALEQISQWRAGSAV